MKGVVVHRGSGAGEAERRLMSVVTPPHEGKGEGREGRAEDGAAGRA
jgi:hypothetical protein